ncbi:MAG TPA: hypothetical protein VGM06_20720 [Polyangiaceae bacterium]
MPKQKPMGGAYPQNPSSKPVDHGTFTDASAVAIPASAAGVAPPSEADPGQTRAPMTTVGSHAVTAADKHPAAAIRDHHARSIAFVQWHRARESVMVLFGA